MGKFDEILNSATPMDAVLGEEIDKKADKAVVDTLSSLANENAVTLGYSGKNLLKNEGVSQTKNEVKFTVNSDNSVTCVGTATASTSFLLSLTPYKSISDFPDKTILSGGTSKIEVGLQINEFKESSKYVYAFVSTGSDTKCDFTNYKQYFAMFYVNIKEGVTVNETVYPMLRPASITDDTYEPYMPSVDERLNGKADISYVNDNRNNIGFFSFNSISDMIQKETINKMYIYYCGDHQSGFPLTQNGLWQIQYFRTNYPTRIYDRIRMSVLYSGNYREFIGFVSNDNSVTWKEISLV